jgi:hypothetical protein
MKLLGKDISPAALAKAIEDRLNARGLAEPTQPIDVTGPEPRVDPAAFFLNGIEANADPTEWLPLHTHRGGLGRAVLLAKWAFRRAAGPLVADALSRQRLFNGHVRDATMQLYAELRELRAEVERLQTERRKPARPRSK